MTSYKEIEKEHKIDPEQGVEQLLEEAGELIIGGRLVKAPASRPKTRRANEPKASVGAEPEADTAQAPDTESAGE